MHPVVIGLIIYFCVLLFAIVVKVIFSILQDGVKIESEQEARERVLNEIKRIETDCEQKVLKEKEKETEKF